MTPKNHPKFKLIISYFQKRYNSSIHNDIYWFHATDHPVANNLHGLQQTEAPKKFTPFSKGDSFRIESLYQRLKKGKKVTNECILVKEDGLFIADMSKLQLAPTYWNGPIYEIRRGKWFYDNSSSSPRPCETELASILDEGYRQIASEDRETLEIDVSRIIPSDNKPGNSDDKKLTSRIIEFTKKLPDQPVMTTRASILFDMTGTSVTKIKKGGFTLKKESEKDAENKIDASGKQDAVEESLKSILASKSNGSNLESQMENDYSEDKTQTEESPIREIDHLVLCIHGIGQKLSQRIESVSFVHDVNLLRKSFKTAYGAKNNRIQVLPVLWRYDVPFAMTRCQLTPRKLPVSLQDITVNGILPVRNIIGDVVLDVLLYAEPRYKDQILDNVTHQMNSIVRKFIKLNQCKRRPNISIIGHSLGSVIAFDLLSSRDIKGAVMTENIPPSRSQLEFSVQNLFMLGSPLGLYQLVHGQGLSEIKLTRNIGALYNIYHPADPISYRIEPLVDYRAAGMDPVPIPYAKGGITSGIQSFGQKFSQNATTFWKSLANYYKQVEEEQFVEEIDDETKSRPIKPDEIDQIKEKLFDFNPFSSRLDYSLQEGFLDISLIAALASHMSYFENEDATKFILNAIRPPEPKLS